MASFPPSAPWARKSFPENYDSWTAEEILIEDETAEKAGSGRGGVNSSTGGGHERGQRGGSGGGGHHARYFHENRRGQQMGREHRGGAAPSSTSAPAYWGGNNFSTVENVTATAGQRAQQCRQARANLFGIVNGTVSGCAPPLQQRCSQTQQLTGCVCGRRPCICGSLTEVDISFLPSYKPQVHSRPTSGSESAIVMEEDNVLEIGEICDDNCTQEESPVNDPESVAHSSPTREEEKNCQDEAQGKSQTQYSEMSTSQTTPTMLLLSNEPLAGAAAASGIGGTPEMDDLADAAAFDQPSAAAELHYQHSPIAESANVKGSESSRKVLRVKSKIKKQTSNRLMTLKSKRKMGGKSKALRLEEGSEAGIFKSDEIQKCGLLLRTGLECGRLRNQIIKFALQFLEMKQQEDSLKRSLRSLIKSAVDAHMEPSLLLGMSTSPAFDKAVRFLLESIADTIQTVKPEDDKSSGDTTATGRAATTAPR